MGFIATCKLMLYVAQNGPQSVPVAMKMHNPYYGVCPVCGCVVYKVLSKCPDCGVAFDWLKSPGEARGSGG